MKIRRVIIEPFKRAFRHPLPGAGLEREGFLLRLVSDTGAVGIGEASPATWVGGESLADIATALHKIERTNNGDTPAARLETLRFAGVPAAASALETALLDLRAQAAGHSVAEALGGIPTTLELSALLPGGGEPGTLRAATVELVGQGFRHLKLKVGASLGQDVERLREVREGAGGAAIIRLDANQAWSESEAVESLRTMTGPDIELVEEPLKNPDPEALARLRRQTNIPVALDESVCSPADLDPYLETRSAKFLVVKLARVGGPSAAIQLARHALQGGLTPLVTDSIETAVGRAAAAHVAAALPEPRAAIGLGGLFLLDDKYPNPYYSVAGPGLGLTGE